MNKYGALLVRTISLTTLWFLVLFTGIFGKLFQLSGLNSSQKMSNEGLRYFSNNFDVPQVHADFPSSGGGGEASSSDGGGGGGGGGGCDGSSGSSSGGDC